MKQETIQIRVSPKEKQGFSQAAEAAGISLSSWVRERLRLASTRELEAIGERAPFIEKLRVAPLDE